MSEFWIITAPGETTVEQTWARLDQKTRRDNDLATNYRYYRCTQLREPGWDHVAGRCHCVCSPARGVCSFKLPDLRIGTIDQLMSLSDDLARVCCSVPSSCFCIHTGLTMARAWWWWWWC